MPEVFDPMDTIVAVNKPDEKLDDVKVDDFMETKLPARHELDLLSLNWPWFNKDGEGSKLEPVPWPELWLKPNRCRYWFAFKGETGVVSLKVPKEEENDNNNNNNNHFMFRNFSPYQVPMDQYGQQAFVNLLDQSFVRFDQWFMYFQMGIFQFLRDI